jgi:hypothetical protein
MRILQRNLKNTKDTFLFISHTTNVLLFKFRCNIFIGVRIIKEMPGSVAGGSLCILSSSSTKNELSNFFLSISNQVWRLYKSYEKRIKILVCSGLYNGHFPWAKNAFHWDQIILVINRTGAFKGRVPETLDIHLS